MTTTNETMGASEQIRQAMEVDAKIAREFMAACVASESAGLDIQDLDDTVVPVTEPSGCPWDPECAYIHSDDVWTNL